MPNRKKDPSQKLDHAIKASFTSAQYEAIAAKAQQAGLLPAEFAHRAILRQRVTHIPTINQQVWTALARPLGNLAKLTQLLYQAKYQGATIPTRLLELLETELHALQHLRQSLVGGVGEAADDMDADAADSESGEDATDRVPAASAEQAQQLPGAIA